MARFAGVDETVELQERWSAVDGIGGEHTSDAAIGLRLDAVEVVPRRVRAAFTLASAHQGAPGRAHGGALMTALDEVMGRAAWLELDREDCLTATLTFDFLKPAPVGAQLEVIGWLDERDGRKLHLRGEVRDGEHVVCAATGLWIEARR